MRVCVMAYDSGKSIPLIVCDYIKTSLHQCRLSRCAKDFRGRRRMLDRRQCYVKIPEKKNPKMNNGYLCVVCFIHSIFENVTTIKLNVIFYFIFWFVQTFSVYTCCIYTYVQILDLYLTHFRDQKCVNKILTVYTFQDL